MKSFVKKRLSSVMAIVLACTLVLPAVTMPVQAEDNHSIPSEVNLHQWKFDEDLGGAIPQISLEVEGGNISLAEGRDGQAAVFDGSGGLYLGTGLITSDTYTISMWINTKYPSDGNYWASALFADSMGGWMSIRHSALAAWWPDIDLTSYDPFVMSYASVLPENTWTHLAAVVQDDEMAVYRDGVLQGTHNGASHILGDDVRLVLGVNFWNDGPFQGMIDEVRIYDNGALTSDGVLALYALQEPEGKDILVPESNLEPENPIETNTLSPIVPERVDNINAIDHGAVVWDFNNSLNGAIPVGIAGFNTIIQEENRRLDSAFTFVEDRHGNENSAVRFGGNEGGAGLYLGEGIIDTDAYTIAFWVKPEVLTTSFASVFFGATADNMWTSLHPATGLGNNRGTLAYWSGSYEPNPWRDHVSDGVLTLDEWHHVSVVVADDVSTIFLDGMPMAMTRTGWPEGTNLAPIFENETGRFFLGLNFFPDPIFTGAIDDLHIFNRPLNTNQIMALYDPAYDFEDLDADNPVLPERINQGLYWSFDEDLGGAAAVQAGNNVQGMDTSLRGHVPLMPGKMGNAAHFTGSSGLYLGDDIITSDTYTVTFWANPSQITDWTSMFFGGNPNRHLSMATRMGGGSTAAFTVPGHTWYFAPGAIPVNTWTHVAFSNDGHRASLYINGQRTYSEENPTDVFGGMEDGQFFAGLNYWDFPFRGLIDELYIYPDQALTIDEIRMLSGIPEGQYMRPGANQDYNDPSHPLVNETTIHDPSLTRKRTSDGWYYAVGTDLGASRTKDFMTWESINDGLGYPQQSNPTGHWSFPEDNLDPEIETIAQQIAYTGAYPNNLEQTNRAIFWANELIEMPDGRFFLYYTLAGGIGEWHFEGSESDHPQAALGLAIAESIDDPFVTQGLFIRSGFANRFDIDGNRVPFNTSNAANKTMYGDEAFNARIHPNAIDASPFFCEEGKLWLVYGSYSGGIFLLEMDTETGLPIPYEDSEINRENDGYGRLLIALTHHQGEGPHMIYSESTGYYYLFLTSGWLNSYGGYHMRMWRSKNPYGPFEDARFGQMHVQENPLQTGGAARWVDADGGLFAHGDMGNKIIGGYHFRSASEEHAQHISYLSPGHGGLIYDAEANRYLMIFHTRFEGRWEWHQVRVHEMVMNSNGWFVMAPLRFDGGDGARTFTLDALVGDYKILHHGRNTNTTANTSNVYRFNEAGDITNSSGETVGQWLLSNENVADITMNGITYNGVFLRQFDQDQQAWVQTFTVISYDDDTPTGIDSTAGMTVWGVGVSEGTAYVSIVDDIPSIERPRPRPMPIIVSDLIPVLVPGADADDTPIKKALPRLPKVILIPAEEQFSDISEEVWYAEPVSITTAFGLFKGTKEGVFEPNTNMNRAMFAQVLLNLADLLGAVDMDGETAGLFEDVPDTAWFNDAVNWAGKIGIVSGVGNGYFAPNDNITREQMVVMLYNFAVALNMDLPQTVETKSFTDKDAISSWARNPVAVMQAAGVIKGLDTGAFNPKATATRAEAASIFAKFLKLFEEED